MGLAGHRSDLVADLLEHLALPQYKIVFELMLPNTLLFERVRSLSNFFIVLIDKGTRAGLSTLRFALW